MSVTGWYNKIFTLGASVGICYIPVQSFPLPCCLEHNCTLVLIGTVVASAGN